MEGRLHVYNPHGRLTAFESGRASSSNAVIFVGGLGDGLAAIPCLPALSDALGSLGGGGSSSSWSLIQPLMRSSYKGWLTGSIDEDAEDLAALESYLRNLPEKKHGKLVLLGHSTGCQDILHFFRLHPDSTYDAAILQAPVSDREIIQVQLGAEDLEKSVQAASVQIKQGRGAYPLSNEILDIIGYGPSSSSSSSAAPITADRWYAQAARGGKEDFFSSDLTDEELGDAFQGLRTRFASIGTTRTEKESEPTPAAAAEQSNGKRAPPLIVLCGEDESYPEHVDKEALLRRFEVSVGNEATAVDDKDDSQELPRRSLSCVLTGADHSITEAQAQQQFIDLVLRYVHSI